MSLIKKIIISSTIFILSSNYLFAQEVKKIGKYKDWEAMEAYEPVSYTHLTLPTTEAV